MMKIYLKLLKNKEMSQQLLPMILISYGMGFISY